MAEFAQIMKDWRRMCDTIRSQGGACAQLCPLSSNLVCGELHDASDEDIREAEDRIFLWALEHPEPKYPTWKDYVESMWLDSYSPGESLISWMNTHHIPADIAEKLGIKQKEGL